MDVIRQVLAIALVFGLLWGALWVVRRKGGIQLFRSGAAAGGSTLEPRAKLNLTPQHSLHWVRIGQRDLLLAVHPSGITWLGDIAPGGVEFQ